MTRGKVQVVVYTAMFTSQSSLKLICAFFHMHGTHQFEIFLICMS